MIEAIKKWRWKRKEIKKLEAEMFNKMAMVVYSNSTIEDLETLKKYDESKRASLIDEKGTLELSTDYEKVRRRREVEKEIEHVDMKIKGRDRGIEQVQQQIVTVKGQIAEVKNRIRVFKERF